MIYIRQIVIILGLDGNLYFKDFTNELSFAFVTNKEDLCWSFFNF